DSSAPEWATYSSVPEDERNCSYIFGGLTEVLDGSLVAPSCEGTIQWSGLHAYYCTDEITHVLTPRDGHPANDAADVWLDRVMRAHQAWPYAYAPANTFPDVPEPLDHVVSWAVDQSITTGYSTGCAGAAPCFKPSSALTRQAAAAFLYRLAGEPAFTTPPAPTFRDVGTGHTFYAQIEWMHAEGISTGDAPRTANCPGTGRPCFRSTSALSRMAVAAFLHRFVGAPASADPRTATFGDVSTTHPFFTEIEWLDDVGAGQRFTTGSGSSCTTSTCYRPLATERRGALMGDLFRLAGSPTAWTAWADDLPPATTFGEVPR
ncbi:hypothetical protein B7486_57135, partial [cyanobacterium TDX16]